ncbi:MAG TPA: hypothetical protein VGG45_16135 [Terracidiphilus sp.]
MGAKNQTSTSSSQPPQQFLNAYTNLVNAGFSQAQQPQQQYGGSLVQGFTPQQNQAFNTISDAQGMAAPFINSAAQYAAQGATPITSNAYNQNSVGQYYSPYQNDVVNSTEQQMNLQNAQQQSGLMGNIASAGALGGDRQAIAQSSLAGQQQTAEAPVIAGLENAGYTNAQGEFNTQNQAQMQAQQATNQGAQNASYAMGMLGPEALNTTLTGASANLQAGGLQQQMGQEQLNIPYEQFQAQQAYPYQQLNWLGGLVEGAGAGAGGTSSTTTPGPNTASQLAGLGMSGLGIAGQAGLFAKGGRIQHRAMGGPVEMEPSAMLAMRLGHMPNGMPMNGIASAGGMPRSLAGGGSTGPTGIATPQVDMSVYAQPPSSQTSQMGNWFNPLPQVQNTTAPTTTQLPQGVRDALSVPISGPGSTQAPKQHGASFWDDLGGVALGGLGALAFMRDGGRPHYDDGGTIQFPDDQPMTAISDASQGAPTRAMTPDETPPSWQGQVTNYGQGKPVWQAAKPSPWRAITDAGLAMAAGSSPNALENVARGLQQGSNEYGRELDTPPVVDHSGATVMIRSPDASGDQQILDTGIPTEAALNAKMMSDYRTSSVSERQDAADMQHEDRGQAEKDRAAYDAQMAQDRLLMAQIAGERAGQGKFGAPAPGQGIDPATGKQVPGAYIANEQTGEMVFHPGVVINARTAQPSGKPSANEALIRAASDYNSSFLDPITGAPKDPTKAVPDRASWITGQARKYAGADLSQNGTPGGTAPATAPAIPQRPPNLPPSAQFSPSQGKWWWQSNGAWAHN